MTTTDITTDIVNTIDVHLAGYCEPDPARRAELLASVWADSGVLVDPPFDGAGRDGIAAMTDVVLQHYPGHTFRRTSAVDAHHSFARYTWALQAADGTVSTSGTDFAELDGNGQLLRIVGFFGDLAT